MLGLLIDEMLLPAAESCSLGDARRTATEVQGLCARAGDAMESVDRDEAARLVAELPDAQIGEVLRFVTARFHLLNQAEQVSIIGVNRERARLATVERPRPESLPDALRRLRELGLDRAAVLALVERLDVQPTLTAHPTEAKRRSVLDNLVHIAGLMREMLDAPPGGRDQHEARARLEVLVQTLLATDDVRPKRLEVIDEVKNGLFFLRSSIWWTVPRLMRDLVDAAAGVMGTGTLHLTELPALVRYRTWIGGDRDGNPRVTHDVTAGALHLMRSTAAELWDRELMDLQQELTLSRRCVPIPEWFVEMVGEEGERFIEDRAALEHRQHEPVRVRLMQMRGRLRRDPSYDGERLQQDLTRIRDAIAESGLRQVALSGRLADAIVRARVFGLHLATLDIRQHSRVHEEVVGELLAMAGVVQGYAGLPEERKLEVLRTELAQPRPLRPIGATLSAVAAELMQTLEVVRHAVSQDRRSVRSFVISMTHGVSDVLEVLLLMKEAGLARFEARAGGPVTAQGTLHVVPLLETIEDLERGEALVAAMLDEPLYRAHLESLVPPGLGGPRRTAPVQEIMLGYSDSNKDGGFLMANVALERGQRRIARAVRSRGVLLRFFYGRGGTVGRGGGRAGRAIMAVPGPARTGRLRFTEQGEVISFRYALPAIAQRHLEQIMHASLVASADDRDEERGAQVDALVERLANESMARYRSLIDDSEFWGWFVSCGPISAIAGLPMASRPVMRELGTRSADGGSAFDQLRAIPWVFSWVQMRCLAPGWFGLGSALASASEAELELLAREYHRWPWLATVIDNAAQELARARMSIVRRYALSGASPAGDRIFAVLQEEYQKAVRGVLRVSGRSALGDEAPIIQRSIQQRNPWTDVLSLIQIELLARRRAAPESARARIDQLLLQSVSALAAAMQSTG